METLILTADSSGYKKGAELINMGELVAFPTETVYGLGANALNTTAVKAIYVAKGRPSDNPLIVHISDKSQLNGIAVNINELAQKVIDNFMPGSITVVLNKDSAISDTITAGLSTVAVRMPASQQARDFISACGVPLVAPSANTSTKPSPTNYSDVLEDMQGKISGVIAGENCQVGIESTVLDVTTDIPTILRPGIVTRSQLSQVLGVEVAVHNSSSKVVNSPGTRYKHYAPSCDMVLNRDGDSEKICNYYDDLTAKGYNVVILTQGESYGERNCYNWGTNDNEIARNMFKVVRQLDKQYNYIIAVYTSTSEFSLSVLNRLTKSCSGRVI